MAKNNLEGIVRLYGLPDSEYIDSSVREFLLSEGFRVTDKVYERNITKKSQDTGWFGFLAGDIHFEIDVYPEGIKIIRYAEKDEYRHIYFKDGANFAEAYNKIPGVIEELMKI